jgi:beta-lactam-binding protein with PASTA domain
VPQVKGKTPAAAQVALLAAHCKLGTVRRAYSRTVRKGRILSQSVAPAKQLANGSAVGVVVSRGRKPVPKVTLCYRRHTIKVTKAKAKILRRHGAKLGACKKR